MKKFLFLGVFTSLILFSFPVQAEEISTSTPEIPTITPTSTEEIVTPTSTLEIDAPTTTIDISTNIEEIILSTSTIHIQIETNDGSLFSNNFTFTACPNTENGEKYTLNAWCAIKQLAEQQNWTLNYSWSEYGLYLSQINQYDGTDSNWWGWYSELDMGMTSLNYHLTTENENLLLTYGVSPLKLEINTTTPAVNTTTTISIKEFGFDENWNSVWISSTSGTLNINGTDIVTDDGTYELYITTTTPYEIFASKNGFITTESTIINPTSTTQTEYDNEEDENTGGENDSETEEIKNTLITNTEINNTASKILDYLQYQQDETGKISDGTITDWIIMSFGAKGIYADDVVNDGDSLLDYEKKYNLDDSSDINICASYPRHILALLAAGVGQSDNAIVGLKNKITNDCYQNNLYGQDGINDDVFALLALLAVETNKNELIIQNIIDTIINDQTNSGAFTWSGWAGADMTGAAINALKYAQNKGTEIDSEIFTNAKNYLKNQQLADGGWGYETSDIMTTSWVLMGLNALGENQSNWFNSQGKNPWYPLIEQLNDDNYYESAYVPDTVDWFAMKHAVPALLKKSWPIILSKKVEDFSSGSGLTYIYTGNENPTTTIEDIASSTIDTTTSTLDLTTTTPEIVTTTLKITTTSSENIILLTNSIAKEKIVEKLTTSTSQAITQTKIIKNQKKEKPITSTTSTTLDKTTQNINSSTSNFQSETAKNIFEISTSMAGIVSLYLIWKLLKSLL